MTGRKKGKKYYKFGKADKSQIDTYHLFNLKLAKSVYHTNPMFQLIT